MLDLFVCDLLGFCARNFPEKSETREPGETILEQTSYVITPLFFHILALLSCPLTLLLGPLLVYNHWIDVCLPLSLQLLVCVY